MIYDKVLFDSIQSEKSGEDYCCFGEDRELLNELLAEINRAVGTKFRYLAELDNLTVKGSGVIVAKYIERLSSESVRAYLIPQIVCDKPTDCDKLILSLYRHFKESAEYISVPGEPSPAHIYVRYDNAFKDLKPKRIKDELAALVSAPRDAFYLPLTVRMLASWKIPELERLLIRYSESDNIAAAEIGLHEYDDGRKPSLEFIKSQLRFSGIQGLKYYDSAESKAAIEQCLSDADVDIAAAARRVYRHLMK